MIPKPLHALYAKLLKVWRSLMSRPPEMTEEQMRELWNQMEGFDRQIQTYPQAQIDEANKFYLPSKKKPEPKKPVQTRFDW